MYQVYSLLNWYDFAAIRKRTVLRDAQNLPASYLSTSTTALKKVLKIPVRLFNGKINHKRSACQIWHIYPIMICQVCCETCYSILIAYSFLGCSCIISMKPDVLQGGLKENIYVSFMLLCYALFSISFWRQIAKEIHVIW